jgi:hypothetical protein
LRQEKGATDARRNIMFSDADFHGLDVNKPIVITITVGELEDTLKSMEAYGQYLRSFDPKTIGARPSFGAGQGC